jgi:hypothetical protein
MVLYRFLKISLIVVLNLFISNCFATETSKLVPKKVIKKEKINKKLNNEILTALKIYEKLHLEFFNYNVENVLIVSKELSEALSKISDKKLVEKLKSENVFKYLSSMVNHKNRSINNSLLDTTSKKLNTIILKDYKVSKNYSLYRCPMVKKVWIQNVKLMKKVHNPYAPKMPHCGARKE